MQRHMPCDIGNVLFLLSDGQVLRLEKHAKAAMSMWERVSAAALVLLEQCLMSEVN